MNLIWENYNPDEHDAVLYKWSRQIGGKGKNVKQINDNVSRIKLFNLFWMHDNIPSLIKTFLPEITSQTEKVFVRVIKETTDGPLVGICILDWFKENPRDRDEGSIFIQHYMVSPRDQGRGIGFSIIRDIQENAKEIIGKQPKEILTSIHNNNTISRRVLEKAGFRDEMIIDDEISVMEYKYENAEERESS